MKTIYPPKPYLTFNEWCKYIQSVSNKFKHNKNVLKKTECQSILSQRKGSDDSIAPVTK